MWLDVVLFSTLIYGGILFCVGVFAAFGVILVREGVRRHRDRAQPRSEAVSGGA